ncbi:ubiquitin carboxyl-terminal hydrolase 5 [Leptopilina boulardi]|uniref:ubiquitin carboxyl-terminal hydrolase 5 n=1 Tax=Leptopilina boulardi TaxID=63433 RepID=UPI0021F6387C|nr:ubiquitin carboxyl-terminal hydrolase 5 [Leptopilina boulardi]
MEELSKHLKKIKVPEGSDKVYKDECVYSFDTPESPTGLYISLSSFFGLSQKHVECYFRETGNAVFLHILKTKKEIPNENMDGPEKKITRLAIGTPGGFNPDQQKYTYEEHYKIVVLPNFTEISYPNEELPMLVQMSVKAILEAQSALKIAEQEALAGTWDGEARVVSKHAENLKQLDNGIKIPPSGWKCEKCDLTQNLWLNLTDGSILCGRKFFDGSGGNDHAVEHYRHSGYPLAVKLGTITKDGKGDVYSYDEDDMVLDPKLIEHLAHWGVNITQMEKTEKSMIELELDLNQKFGDWVTLQESSTKVYGPGHTGLVNLGNSCYLNSVLQTLFVIPDFINRYHNEADKIFTNSVHNPPNDINVQMAKLSIGLLSGQYAQPPKSDNDESSQGISPRMFKHLVGRGHQEFSSNRQQDAQEFFLHLINLLEQNNHHLENAADCFKFKVEERYECNSSKKVQYTSRPEYLLPLPIALDCAINKEQVDAYLAKKDEAEKNNQKLDFHDIVRPRIKLSSCLEAFAKSEIIEQFYSTALKEKTTAVKTTKLATFPDYLLIHLKKFTAKEDWTPIKLDVEVEMPDLLDLSWLEGKGLQPNEELLPEVTELEHPQPQYDPAIIDQLTEMGFPLEACKRAVFFTENGGFEEATNWLMTHIADDNFSEPFVPPGIMKKNQNSFVPNEERLVEVMSMGFTEEKAIRALKATNNNMKHAVDWLFSHLSDSDETPMEVDTNSKDGNFRNGSGRYKLIGFISHMGTSSMVGHYVCHLLKEKGWILFNDEKVAVSENPPKDLGYIYLYERLD